MKKLLLTLALVGPAASAAQAQTTIEFWHSFGDAKRSGWIQARADAFNKANPGVKVDRKSTRLNSSHRT